MSFALLTHIISATITLLTCAYAWHKPDHQLQKFLNLSGLVSVLSGILVTLSAHSLTLLYCAKLGLYLLAIALTNYMLYSRFGKLKASLPTH